MDLDQSFPDSLRSARAEEISGARFQRSGATVHDPEKPVSYGGEERGVVRITWIDFDHYLPGGRSNPVMVPCVNGSGS